MVKQRSILQTKNHSVCLAYEISVDIALYLAIH